VQLDFPIMRLVALARRLPSNSVFSGRTAAWLHGMDVPPCDPVEVTLPGLSCRSHIAGVALTRSDVAESEIDLIHTVRVTGPCRTVADLGRRLPLVEAVVILDTAIHGRFTKPEELRNWADSHPGFRGVRVLRRALKLADGRAESPMETRLRLLLLAAGLPGPELQTPLYDSDGFFIARPDLYYPLDRLAIEYDGATHRHSLAADNRRQNRLLEAGYRLLRFTAADVLRAPVAVISQVERALATPGVRRTAGFGEAVARPRVRAPLPHPAGGRPE
jgi:hypothetical protein